MTDDGAALEIRIGVGNVDLSSPLAHFERFIRDFEGTDGTPSEIVIRQQETGSDEPIALEVDFEGEHVEFGILAVLSDDEASDLGTRLLEASTDDEEVADAE